MYFPDAERRDAGHIILREERIQYFLNWSDPPPLSGEGRRRIVVRAGHESQNLVAEADRAGPWMAATNKPTVCTFSRGASASVRHRMTWPVPISNEA